MQYMLLIYSEPAKWEGFTDNEALMGEFMTYTEELVAAGVMVGGAPLTPAEEGKRVKAGGVITDGPFAETTEALGGYYIVDVPTIDEALAWAAKVPTAVRGLDNIEVRAVVNMG